MVFLLLDWLLFHRKREGVISAAREYLTWPASEKVKTKEQTTGRFFHPGHSWIRIISDGSVAVGTNDFVTRFMGELQKVEIPEVGTRLRQGQPAWTFVSRQGRKLTQVMPVDGEITEVNQELLENPELLKKSPYEAGWIARVHPSHLQESLRNLLTGRLAKAWMNAIKSRVTSRLTPEIGLAATDGGELAPNLGDIMDSKIWESFKEELFPNTNSMDK